MSTRRRTVLAGLVVLVGVAVAPSTVPAAPEPEYDIFTDGGSSLGLRPAPGFSALNVNVTAGPGNTIEFRPPARVFPATADPLTSCSSDAVRTSCPQALVASRLRFAGNPEGTIASSVIGVDTDQVRLDGREDTDDLTVTSPAITPAQEVTLNPGAGNDVITINGAPGLVRIDPAPDPVADLDTGDDRYTITATTATGTLDLGPGNDRVDNASSALQVNGDAGADTIISSGKILGGAGNDRLIPTAVNQDIDGGDDRDVLSYQQAAAALSLTIDAGTVTGDGAKTGIEVLEGSPLNDVITGHGGVDTILGGGGDDAIAGRGGTDSLDGGPGADALSFQAGPGPVTANQGTGSAVTPAGTASFTSFERIDGSPQNDTLIGSSESEVLSGGDGDDLVDGGPGNDTLAGGGGNDSLRPQRGNDVVDGGPGADTLLYDDRGASEPVSVNLAAGTGGAAGEGDGISGVENVVGGASNDTLVGDGGPNALDGRAGLNTIEGGAGADLLVGGDSRDVISGGPGPDVIRSGDDDDSVNAQDGEPDSVDCGPSQDDDAQTDAVDAVAGCEFARRGDVPIPIDGDGDGFVAGAGPGLDCNDGNPGISPQATDVPGNRVDEDCDGLDTPTPYLDIKLGQRFSAASKSRTRRIARLVVSQVPAGGSARVTCRAPKRLRTRCAFSARTRKPARGRTTVDLRPLFKNRQLPPGTRVEMRITAPRFNGRVIRYSFQSGAVRRSSLCITAPSKVAKRCPEGEELG